LTREIRTRWECGGFVRRPFPSARRYADLFVLLDEMGSKATEDDRICSVAPMMGQRTMLGISGNQKALSQ